MSVEREDESMEDNTLASNMTISPIWPKGRTSWPSQPTALLIFNPELGGISIASNQPEIDQTIKGLSDALSQLPASGMQNQQRQNRWLIASGISLSRDAAMKHLRTSFANSEILFFEGIDRADWRELKKHPKTSVHYPVWHLPDSEMYHHRSSAHCDRRLPPSHRDDGSIRTPDQSQGSSTAGLDRGSGKRGAQRDFETPDFKRPATDGPDWGAEAQEQSLDGDTEMEDA